MNEVRCHERELTVPPQSDRMTRYYRVHSHIYDCTRWSFLFGRRQIIEEVKLLGTPRYILEVGCGTGANLEALARSFPKADIIGVDIAAPMLEKAKKRLRPFHRRVELVKNDYRTPLHSGGFDLVLFSYSLTMMNPGWERALLAAEKDLAPSGQLAVVDFDRPGMTWFGEWMACNHVRMDGHLLPALERRFTPVISTRFGVYCGLWRYFLFLGDKRNNVSNQSNLVR